MQSQELEGNGICATERSDATDVEAAGVGQGGHDAGRQVEGKAAVAGATAASNSSHSLHNGISTGQDSQYKHLDIHSTDERAYVLLFQGLSVLFLPAAPLRTGSYKLRQHANGRSSWLIYSLSLSYVRPFHPFLHRRMIYVSILRLICTLLLANCPFTDAQLSSH